jgi:23S rRNA G2445 N2-methylase RlmL
MIHNSDCNYFVLATRGLEELVQAEVRAALPQARVYETAYRRVLLHGPDSAAATLTGLRTADDAFVLLADWRGIESSKAGLDQLAELTSEVAFDAAVALCARLRPLAQPLGFAVSASFVGQRRYTSPQLKLALADAVTWRQPWEYLEHEAPDGLSLRLFIEHERALLGLRLAAQPLHRRPYWQANVPGALRPPLAAALLRLAGCTPGSFCVDPFCGAGTIVIEAALHGTQALGGDNDPQVLQAARANLAASGAYAELRQWDAARLPLADASVDCIASNMPFGRQVLPGSDLAQLYHVSLAEMARVLLPGGQAALLSTQTELLLAAVAAQPTLHLLEQREISLHGQTPRVVVVRKA